MSRYIGNYLRVPSLEPQQASAPGIWSLSDQLAYQRANVWPPARDPYYNQTVLHLSGDVAGTRETNPVTQPRTFLSDASTNNFLLISNGDVSARPFSPYQHSYSVYFGGNYGLETTGVTAIGTNDFAIEVFVYPMAYTYYAGIFGLHTNSTAYGPAINLTTTGQVSTGIRNGTGSIGAYTSSANAAPLNTWTHIVLTRISGVMNTYVNGVLLYSVANTTNCDSTLMAIGQQYADYSPSGRGFTGYISNARAVSGINSVNAFTGTVPAAKLQKITGTFILACHSNRWNYDEGSNYTISADSGTPVVSANSPFVEYDTTSGSGYFDGTGDYLTAPDNAAFAMGTGDFTVECFIYTLSSSSTAFMILDTRNADNDSTGFVIYRRATGKLTFAYDSGGFIAIEGATTINANTWYHVMVTRSSNSVRLFVNGNLDSSAVSVTNNFSRQANTRIAASWSDTNACFGYISSLRILKGTALQTASFSFPTAPLTAITNTSLLTLQTRAPANNQGILDTSPNNFVVTRTGNVAQGSFSPFSASGWSVYTGGTGNYITAASNANFAIGTTGTVEGWYYWTVENELTSNNTLNKRLWSVTNNLSNLDAYLSNRNVYMHGGMGVNTTSANLQVNTWYHIAAVYNSGTIKIFVNGVQQTLAGTTTGYNITGSGAFGINTLPGQSPYEATGYASNVRVVKGTALYISNFTPSTNPLTYVDGTVLLTCQSPNFIDNGPNRLTITPTGSPKIQPFSPFAPTQAYVASQLGGSAYFDGTNDYLSIPNVAFNNITTGTVECWVYLTDISGACITAKQQDGVTTQGLFTIGKYASTTGLLTTGTPGILYWHSTNTSPATANSTAGIVANTWNHIAIVFNSSSVTFYINGVASGTTNGNYSLPSNTTPVPTIGQWIAGGIQQIGTTGWISSLRITADSVYSGNFTVPTAPPTAVPGTSLLLNFTGAGIVDSTGRNVVETVGNAHLTTSGTVPVNGTTGILVFDGTGDFLKMPYSEIFNIGSGDYTVEAWIYPTQHGEIIGAFNLTGPNYAGWLLSTNFGPGGVGKLSTFFANTSASQSNIYSTTSVSLNTWSHVVFTKQSTTIRLFINGNLDTTGTLTLVPSGSNQQIHIGADSNSLTSPTRNFGGYIDDLRITKGYARYAAGTGNTMIFTGTTIPALPTKPFSIG